MLKAQKIVKNAGAWEEQLGRYLFPVCPQGPPRCSRRSNCRLWVALTHCLPVARREVCCRGKEHGAGCSFSAFTIGITLLPICGVLSETGTQIPLSRNWRGASLVDLWWRVHLSRQKTRVRSLAWEGPTCRGATKLMCHNYWVCALEARTQNYWAHMLQLLNPVCPCSETREATPMRSLLTATSE